VLCLKFEGDWDRDWIGDDCDSNGDGSLHWEDDGESAGRFGHLARGRRKRRRKGFMVSGSSDCSVCVWDLDLGPVVEYNADMDAYSDQMHVDDDGERQVTAEVRAILKGHSGGVLDLRIDEHWIVSCSKDAVIRVWDRKTLGLHRTLRGHEGPVNAIGLQSGRVVRNWLGSKNSETESQLSFFLWLGQCQRRWKDDIVGYREWRASQDV
jgi:F-box and WD-40 domain protein 1/11